MLLATALLAPLAAHADQGRFDLLGPNVDVHVTRGDRSLPIANVPNLQPGDKLQVHADLPASQSVHLLLVVVFLRGTTNPPPDSWFTRIETWNKKQAAEGVTVTVPAEAQQALIFIAPETGGDFSTLRSAVQGRPGTFVRAVQDLNQASFEQSRIEHYVQALQRVKGDSSAEILDHSHKLAATLNLKPNDDCFKRPADEQVTCLQQTGASVLLDDGHGQTLAQQLTSGDSSTLIGAMQGTPVVANTGAAVYSAYVGTVLDVVRLMTGLHTAHFQYIPAIAFPNKDALNLRLNTAPSFHNPKSVIVIALPAIHKAEPPPLQLADPAHVSCLLQPQMVLPLVGAPLVFATGFAHDLVLHLDTPAADGRIDLPLTPDAFEGGLIIADSGERKVLAPNGVPMPANGATQVPAQKPANQAIATGPKPAAPISASTAADEPIQIHGTVHGYWGFDAFTGPTVPLQQRPGTGWTAAASTELFTGRVNSLLLHANGAGCVRQVQWATDGADRTLEWHTDSAAVNTLTVKLPLEKAAPGGINLQVTQFGTAAVERVHATAYSDVTRIQKMSIHAGDGFATVTGSGLQEISGGTLDGLPLAALGDVSSDGTTLRLSIDPDAALTAKKLRRTFKDGEHGTATLALRDGRTLNATYIVDAARPSVVLLNRSVTALPAAAAAPGAPASPAPAPLPLSLSDKKAIPLRSRVTLALRTESPAKFSRSEKVEVGTTDGTLRTELTLSNGGMVLQDNRTAIAMLEPEKAFGASAFGPLQFRVVTDEAVSDWLPLGTLVRTPAIQQVTCIARSPGRPAAAANTSAPTEPTASTGDSAAPDLPCTLTGTDLFLIDAVSADAAFTSPTSLPEGFAQDSVRVPRPADGHTLYLRLRDDPTHTASVVIESRSPSTR